jgi:Tfp pilus assembly protein PilF
MVRRFTHLADAGSRMALSSMLGASLCLSGCATSLWSKSPPVKYETVATNKRRDNKTAQVKHAEALVLIETGTPHKLHKAEKLLNEALVADVRYGPAHNSLGMVYYLENKLYLAAWEFEYAAKLMPEHPQPYNNLGLVYERAGKYEDAISYYSMALSRDDGDPEVMGNLVRARLDNGEKGQDLKSMISDLALYHPDPKWQEWARDQVALAKFDKSPSGLTDPWPQSTGTPEVLPAPIKQTEPAKASDSLPTPKMLEFPESVSPGKIES